MKVSSKIRYALQGLLDLAERYGAAGPVSVKELAARHGISEKFLEGIFSQLRAKGLVDSIKGKTGGYLLADRPERISLLDVMLVFEPYVVFDTDAKDDAVDVPIWTELERDLRERLSSQSLSDLLLLIKKDRGVLNYVI
ncbi:Rrf2 family transcriptional regulator [Spirochaetia bacterium 38H-sp]|uniref:Rrf2 family transcriptional regulator n=1 Tax=Rarispira pelagica TaxID=3141764 RepID=A0ABU9UBC1_9SPIR